IATGREGSDQRRVLLDCLFQEDRAHPRIVHVSETRPDRRSDMDEVTFIGLSRTAAKDRLAEMILAQFLVMGKAAGREDARLARLEPQYSAVVAVDIDAHHAAVIVDDDALDAMARADIDPLALCCL